MQHDTDTTAQLFAALELAERTIAASLAARGYQSGSCTDEWAAPIPAEVAALAQIRATLADPRMQSPRLCNLEQLATMVVASDAAHRWGQACRPIVAKAHECLRRAGIEVKL